MSYLKREISKGLILKETLILNELSPKRGDNETFNLKTGRLILRRNHIVTYFRQNFFILTSNVPNPILNEIRHKKVGVIRLDFEDKCLDLSSILANTPEIRHFTTIIETSFPSNLVIICF